MPACRISAAAAAAYAFWAAPNNARQHISPTGAANLIPNKRRYIDPPGMAALNFGMKRGIAVLFTLALFAWLLRGGHLQALAIALSDLSPRVVILTALGLVASYIFRALRVYDEFRREARGRFGACLRIVLVHNAMVNVLPFRSGEFAFPMLLQRTFGTPLPRAVASLVWFRLQDACVIGLIAIFIWPDISPFIRIVAASLVVTLAWAVPHLMKIRPRQTTPAKPTTTFAKVRDAFQDSTQQARFGWLWTLANWSAKLAVQGWLLAALLGGAFPEGVAGALGAELSSVLPIQGVAGFGTYEAGAAAALLPLGVPLTEAIRAAFALHLFVTGCAVLAGGIAWAIPIANRSPRGTAHPTSTSQSAWSR